MQNVSFVGALAAVGIRQDLILELIISDDHAAQGAYTFQFYKHGTWHQVVVDNYLPCLEEPQDQRLAFTCSSTAGELWPSLLEKAYAKLHGSFYALEGGPIEDILVDLTGGIVTKRRLSLGNDSSESGAVCLPVMDDGQVLKGM